MTLPLHEPGKFEGIAAGVLAALAMRRVAAEAEERCRLEELEYQRTQWVKEEERRQEKARGQAVEDEAGRWIKSREISAYVLACEAELRKSGVEPDEQTTRELAWRRTYAEKLNPLTNLRCRVPGQVPPNEQPRSD